MLTKILFLITIFLRVKIKVCHWDDFDDFFSNEYGETIDLKVLSGFGNDHLELNIAMPGNVAKSFKLFKTNRLMTDETIVWVNSLTKDNEIKSRKKLIRDILEDINFYQNSKIHASMVTYKNDDGINIVEGIVEDKMIRFFPKNCQYRVINISRQKANIPRRNSSLNEIKPDSYHLNTNLEEINIKLLINTYWNDIMYKNNSDVMKDILIHYNSVDLMFSNFTSPKIKLTLAAIVIPQDKESSYELSEGSEFIDSFNITSSYPGSCYDLAINVSIYKFPDPDDFNMVQNFLVLLNRRNETRITRFLNPHGYDILSNTVGTAQLFGYFLGSNFNYFTDTKCDGIMNRCIDDKLWPMSWSICDIDRISKAISDPSFQKTFCNYKVVKNEKMKDEVDDKQSMILALVFGIPGLICLLVFLFCLAFFMFRYIPPERRPLWLDNIQEKYNCYIPTIKKYANTSFEYTTPEEISLPDIRKAEIIYLNQKFETFKG